MHLVHLLHAPFGSSDMLVFIGRVSPQHVCFSNTRPSSQLKCEFETLGYDEAVRQTEQLLYTSLWNNVISDVLFECGVRVVFGFTGFIYISPE